jgi:hypothetical protein
VSGRSIVPRHSTISQRAGFRKRSGHTEVRIHFSESRHLNQGENLLECSRWFPPDVVGGTDGRRRKFAAKSILWWLGKIAPRTLHILLSEYFVNRL